MIKVSKTGKRVIFNGKDAILLNNEAKRLGLSTQNLFTGLLWEYLMKKAREGLFKK